MYANTNTSKYEETETNILHNASSTNINISPNTNMCNKIQLVQSHPNTIENTNKNTNTKINVVICHVQENNSPSFNYFQLEHLLDSDSEFVALLRLEVPIVPIFKILRICGGWSFPSPHCECGVVGLHTS